VEPQGPKYGGGTRPKLHNERHREALPLNARVTHRGGDLEDRFASSYDCLRINMAVWLDLRRYTPHVLEAYIHGTLGLKKLDACEMLT
jgi:hypothetical protein